MRLLKILPAFAALYLATGCASIIDGPTQNITLRTPGATEAECMLTNGVKYRVQTDETVRIMRSRRDLVVDCYASGDRHKQIVIESATNAWGLANVSNGVVPGTTYDHYAGGLYIYPREITVDFVGMPTRGFETPDYQNKDAPNPYKQAIEPYAPNTPRIPNDTEFERRGVEKRSANLSSNPFATDANNAGVSPMPAPTAVPVMTPSKPNLSGSTAEELNRSANPDVFDPEMK
jgi:hypothetical protein